MGSSVWVKRDRDFLSPRDIPEHIEVDVSSLRIGDVIKVSDIKISENLKVLSVADEMVVSVIRHQSKEKL